MWNFWYQQERKRPALTCKILTLKPSSLRRKEEFKFSLGKGLGRFDVGKGL